MIAYLVDDEPNCTEVLQVLLERYCPKVEVRAVFNDAELALAAIQKAPPELLFLDIEMPRLNGFDLLRACGMVDFPLIFTTAYDKYAIKAFKFSALDYLLKPLDKDDLVAAVQRARLGTAPNAAQLVAAQQVRQQAVPERIALPSGNELLVVAVAEIIFCESAGSYVSVHVINRPKPVVVSKSLREFQELLEDAGFFRAHNSFLVNLGHIKKIVRGEGGEMLLSEGHSVPVARSKMLALLNVVARI